MINIHGHILNNQELADVACSASPIKPKLRQKFGKFKFVRICDEMPSCMSHFPSGLDAIVEGTYSQLYGGENIDSYSLYLIKDGVVVNTGSWYCEDQLTLLDEQDFEKAEIMVETYNFRGTTI